MTQEEKNILLKDISARLPYGVKILDIPANVVGDLFLVSATDMVEYVPEDETNDDNWNQTLYNIKPYLRPMSSMTEDEINDLVMHVVDGPIIYDEDTNLIIGFECNTFEQFALLENWLNEHYFDYHGLIEKGLALEAPEGMYKQKND